ncbi:MAG: hypothetical protein HY271_01190 [Deltaproteobacteria bacterium]|nr:hypothetical protein [Deltaproteobacteria bacterium]
MLVDVIRAQHERVRSALAALASLTAPTAERVARAVAEVERAFADDVPVWATTPIATIRTLTGCEAGGIDRQLARLSPAELAALVGAFLDLYTIACREYWTA